MNDFRPTKPNLKEITKINCYEANHDSIAYATASVIINPWNTDLAKPFKKLKETIFNILENNTTKGIETFVQKCDQYSKTGYRFLPKTLVKKIVNEIKDINEASDWINNVEFLLSPEGKVFENEYKANVLKIKEFVKRIKLYADPKIQVENPSFRGITGACERDRTQYFTKKSAPIVKDLEELLITRIHDKLPEINYFISRNNELNYPETNRLLASVSYNGHFDFCKYVLKDSFVDLSRR